MFLISADGYLVTNYHCIEKARTVYIRGINGDFKSKHEAKIIAKDQSSDLALLKILDKDFKLETPVFGVRSQGVAQAEKVFVLGYPAVEAMGDEIKITDGIISARSGVQGDVSKFQISAPVNPGNSGGPLIDEQGNLIGVIFAKSTIAESAGYAVKANCLETFLNNVDGFTLADKPLTEKIAELRKFIFIIETK